MTAESAQPQEVSPETGQIQSQEAVEPNESGFAGDPSIPEPDTHMTGAEDGESVAVPAGDLTGAITAAIEQTTTQDES